MPLRGESHSDLVRDEAPYFESLAELDAWFAQPHDKLSGVLPYRPRSYIDGQSESRGKLLICHDFKVREPLNNHVRIERARQDYAIPSIFGHTAILLFSAFSHNRVTIPPSGWINAAHKQGTRMLGTLIFEHLEAQPDCLQLVVGRAAHVVKDEKIPISQRYAVVLAKLAHQRGFDGYLLNFECPLPYEAGHARALAAWILLLRAELRARVGPHAQVMWYDSVIYDGFVWHQNRLNGYNLPFFLVSDAFFTNYWWKPETQTSMIQYFTNLTRPNTVPGPSTSAAATKTLQSIYSGVDVWPGRGQYGDSGFCCYRAFTHTNPLGLSTAIFAPGWTWEGATESPEQNWKTWWENERKLWLGPLSPGEIISVPDSPEGPFKPATAFFQDLPPPDPFNFTFYTNFSPGVGYSWFVEGKKVLDTKDGWTDIDKQCSIGNLVWPWPTPSWHGVEQDEALPTASTALDMTGGYCGGNTLKLTLTHAGSELENAVKAIWLPVQSLAVTTRESFEARVVYKTIADTDVDFNPYVYVKSLSKDENNSAPLTVSPVTISELPYGWAQQVVNFTSTSTRTTELVAIGFLVDVKPKDPSAEVTFSLSLGQLAVYPTPPSQSVSIGTPSIAGAKFTPTRHIANPFEGILTWDIASTFTPVDVNVDDKESTTPAWLLHDTPTYRFPTFVYFNVYAVPLDLSVDVGPDTAVFIGTTGLGGHANRLYVERACFPTDWAEQVGIRFWIQGVTDRGEVLPWERCATVDHRKSRFARI